MEPFLEPPETGGTSGGLVTLNFILMIYGTAPTGTYTYALLYNATNGSFTSGTNSLITTTSTTVSANTVSFVVNTTNLSNGYYTVIWSTTGVLPVILTGFTATAQAGNGLLQWSTSQETGSDHFDIERQADATGFTTIGTVSAKGASTTTATYSFTDSHPAAGWNYYRLKTLDIDGNSTYSAIRSIYFEANEQVALTIYPNPVTDRLHITVANATGEISVLVIKLHGTDGAEPAIKLRQYPGYPGERSY